MNIDPEDILLNEKEAQEYGAKCGFRRSLSWYRLSRIKDLGLEWRITAGGSSTTRRWMNQLMGYEK